MNNFKALLFDLDGTLLDTLEDLAESMNMVLRTMHCPTHAVAAYRYFVGDGMKTLALRVLPPDRQDQHSINLCLKGMASEYGRRWHEKTRLYKGIPQLLTALQESGLRLTILSNKPDDFTKNCVKYFLSRWSFAAVEGAKSGVPKKPDPAGALTIAQALKLEPEEFLYLGDTNTDMQTASSAGMYPAGALWGFRTAPELKNSGAKLLLKSPEELLKHI